MCSVQTNVLYTVIQNIWLIFCFIHLNYKLFFHFAWSRLLSDKQAKNWLTVFSAWLDYMNSTPSVSKHVRSCQISVATTRHPRLLSRRVLVFFCCCCFCDVLLNCQALSKLPGKTLKMSQIRCPQAVNKGSNPYFRKLKKENKKTAHVTS